MANTFKVSLEDTKMAAFGELLNKVTIKLLYNENFPSYRIILVKIYLTGNLQIYFLCLSTSAGVIIESCPHVANIPTIAN